MLQIELKIVIFEFFHDGWMKNKELLFKPRSTNDYTVTSSVATSRSILWNPGVGEQSLRNTFASQGESLNYSGRFLIYLIC